MWGKEGRLLTCAAKDFCAGKGDLARRCIGPSMSRFSEMASYRGTAVQKRVNKAEMKNAKLKKSLSEERSVVYI